MSRAPWTGVVVVAAAAVAIASCDPQASRCTSDLDCGTVGLDPYHACKLDEGICICTDDRGCGAGETCNIAGRCQRVSGCQSNDDCGDEPGLFCDVATAQCISAEACGAGQTCCTLDSHCPFGSVCDGLRQACVPGCRDEGDCRLGLGCVGGGLGRLGHCGTECTNDALCRPGEICNLAEGECQLDTRGPYCLGCSGGVQSDDCGELGNYCLLDTINGGAYCGVDCSQGQSCPNGYQCRDVIILPRATLPICRLPEACVVPDGETVGTCSRFAQIPCERDEQCPEGPPGSDCPRADVGNCELAPFSTCTTDADCPELGPCLKQECRVREGAIEGTCSCTRDADCPADRCIDVVSADVGGHCELSGHRCFGDIDCDVISCVQGGCRIGKNCKPSSDRSCADFVDAF